MPNIIYQYQNSDGEFVRIEATDIREKARSGRNEENLVRKVQMKFEEALGTISAAANGLKKVIDEVNPDEVSVEFMLKAEGETGFFTICRAATGAEFKITLTWKNAQ